MLHEFSLSRGGASEILGCKRRAEALGSLQTSAGQNSSELIQEPGEVHGLVY